MKSKIIFTLVFAAFAINANASTVQSVSVTKLLMKSAKVDLSTDTVTLPLHLGKLKDGRNVWFILTDVNDRQTAQNLGLVYAPSLDAARGASSTRTATVDSNGIFTFEAGTVDFSYGHDLLPGDAPNYFPPKKVQPGSVGDSAYSPFVRVANQNNTIFNAPIIAFGVVPSEINFCGGNVDHDLVHDKVTAICPTKMEVTLKLGHGFADGKSVVYISTDSNDPTPATMESSTYAPAMNDLKSLGVSETLYGFANGATGVNNPDRQGFNSALAGEGSPLNILEGLTENSSSYSPLWDVNIAVWTDQAIQDGKRVRLTSGDDVGNFNQMGFLMSPKGGMLGSLGLLVNCPVIGFVN